MKTRHQLFKRHIVSRLSADDEQLDEHVIEFIHDLLPDSPTWLQEVHSMRDFLKSLRRLCRDALAEEIGAELMTFGVEIGQQGVGTHNLVGLAHRVQLDKRWQLRQRSANWVWPLVLACSGRSKLAHN